MARICVIRQLYFPLDPRVRKEVDALALAGHAIDVVCMRRPDEPYYERDGAVTIRRLPLQHDRGGSLPRYLFEYSAFLVLATLLVGVLHLRRWYQLVQVNTPPDSLVFAALIPRLCGARVLLDLQECMPEFFASKFGTSLRHPGVRLMAWLELAAIRFASAAITPTGQMRDAFVARGAPGEKIGVILNGADEAIFDADRYPARPREPGRFTLICHGSVAERYGLDTVIHAVALLRDEIPGLEFRVFGEGAYLPALRRLARDLGVAERVYFSDGFVPMPELLTAIADADIGIVAMKRDAFRDLTLCLKMFDYIAMRKPAIVSRTRSVEDYFDESCFAYFTSGDAADLARAIRELHADPARAAQLVLRASARNEPYRWQRQRENYLDIVASLLDRAAGTPGRRLPDARRGGAMAQIGDEVR